ncbi:MAG TPA: peptidase S10 [Alphaproteobacteria bacterium]|nr:peptidase S10 [Alphaproteobacteria bacterium]
MMKKPFLFVACAVLATAVFADAADDANKADKSGDDKEKAEAAEFFKPTEKMTDGTVTVDGTAIRYQAVAGTLVVHPRGWNDVSPLEGSEEADTIKKDPEPVASMFYVAYFKKGAEADKRPITFLYNGGPGSSTVWLHMGAFGPRRVVTADDTHTPAAPYEIVNNDSSLLDASDMVFIDAPGTGFSRIAGKDAGKAFYGVDQDAYAFTQFILEFLSKYGRWNSPKYLFGESYGTVRSSVVVDKLVNDDAVDFNGVILLSQCLNGDLLPDGPEANPAVDLPYEMALPTYAATAWYHHRLPGNPPARLEDLVSEVENFAMTDYHQALAAGLSLQPGQKQLIAQKLHDYTGLPIDYILKANLRISGGEFEENLQGDKDLTTGRLDTRFSGPTLDPLSKEADYDPQSAAISSAYVSAFNDYVRKSLLYGQGMMFKPVVFDETISKWDFTHKLPPPQAGNTSQTPNVMLDLADAIKQNPNLKVLLNAGYFDLATPFYEGIYEMRHLQIPPSLFSNISFKFYESGHMVYAHPPCLKELHDNVAAFIRSTDNIKN